MDNVFLEALAAIDPLTFLWFIAFLWFTARFGKITVPSGVQEGDFIQKVYIYSEQDPKVIKHGTVLIDPGNNGPNLITEDVMRYVHGQPTGSEQVIRIYDGDEKKVGGEVELSFSGPSLKSRRYTETFRHVPRIVDGIDMVLNHDFYVKRYPDKIPSMLMIRWGRGNEKSKGQKQDIEAREQSQEENAQQQEAERREELRVAEEKRKAKEAQYGDHSKDSSGENRD